MGRERSLYSEVDLVSTMLQGYARQSEGHCQTSSDLAGVGGLIINTADRYDEFYYSLAI